MLGGLSTVRIGPRLFRAVEAGLLRNVPQYGDRSDETAALVVADVPHAA
ncbi:hypothetical protein [Streptomyces sp. NPDC001833]